MSKLIDSSFKITPKTGVIYVMAKAHEQGYYYGNQDWINLGQGAPEIGAIDGSPERLSTIKLSESSLEYAPVEGVLALRQVVAELYNKRYRIGKNSKYRAENVAISPGGRSALVRIVATLSNINLGHFLPDYTAYEELLDVFHSFVAIPITSKREQGFKLDPDLIEKSIIDLGLGALLLSNPCNPTGQVLDSNDLQALTKTARRLNCSLILDEFYSHYLYDELPKNECSLSASTFVEDVNNDNIVIIDGMTKNWRYPGLRISWTLAPKHIIDGIASSGSFLDGGAPHILQNIVTPLLSLESANAEAKAIQKLFTQKRDLMVTRLQKMGFEFEAIPEGGFYCFPSLAKLPMPLQDGMKLFKALLKEKVITVPGEFFDVNPGQRRKMHSRLKNYIRFSFGPEIEQLNIGLNRLEALLSNYNT